MQNMRFLTRRAKARTRPKPSSGSPELLDTLNNTENSRLAFGSSTSRKQAFRFSKEHVMSFGLSAPVARFVRAIASSALAAAVVAVGAQVDTLKDIVVDVVRGVPGLSVDSETTIAFVAVAVVVAVVQAADKHFRDAGLYSNHLE